VTGNSGAVTNLITTGNIDVHRIEIIAGARPM
jgi:hypothetical protein